MDLHLLRHLCNRINQAILACRLRGAASSLMEPAASEQQQLSTTVQGSQHSEAPHKESHSILSHVLAEQQPHRAGTQWTKGRRVSTSSSDDSILALPLPPRTCDALTAAADGVHARTQPTAAQVESALTSSASSDREEEPRRTPLAQPTTQDVLKAQVCSGR